MKNLVYPNVVLESNVGVIVKDDNGGKMKISSPMGIECLEQNIDTQEERANIWFDSRGVKKNIICSRENYLNANNLMAYQKYGMDIMKRFISYSVMHFRNEEENAPLRKVHSTLGFGKYQDIEIFKHYEAIGVDSNYVGGFAIQPRGSKEVVRKLIVNEIVDYAPSLLILLFSLSAVVIGYLSEIIDMDTTIIHLLGNTTTGKSTMSKFAVSLFGNPGVKKNGLFFTYNATDNALFKKLCGLKGIPVAIDELSMANFKDRENFVYKLAGGKK